MPGSLTLPLLIPVEPRSVTVEDGSEAVALHDPSGVVPDVDAVALSPAAWWLAAHFDGRRTPDEIAARARAEGLEVTGAEVAELADALARAGFLEGPVHDGLRARALAKYRRAAARAPSCAGGVYPSDPAALRAALDGWLAHADGVPRVRAPTLLVAPHIDYRRGAVGYAHAYRALAEADADLFVVFGTAHASPASLFTLTRLDYGTPLGPVRTDRAVVDALVADLGEDALLADELHHRDEHSVELQLVVLAHVLRRPFAALPVLCSSISHLLDPAAATAPFLAALARALAGRRVCYVAGADLAHVGPMYGDARAPTPAELAALAAQDRRTLSFLAAGDPEGFHRDAVLDDDRRRLCGIAPIYAAMKASGARARVLHYAQWTDGTDSVSYAAAAG
ncbi:AmmeMemoRadiSam system protein B [Anaeromyxobacter oryzisoli]|uniref:AmmeMemoRadiSam system protein B n=1 Tax=Anaeromyxobacter oryzisoli TaxID=2925408 RepID=UPI001F56F639|nr:AmmeMemoRadiSam system protein B [Anaeromyxobacter sp. SG63]